MTTSRTAHAPRDPMAIALAQAVIENHNAAHMGQLSQEDWRRNHDSLCRIAQAAGLDAIVLRLVACREFES